MKTPEIKRVSGRRMMRQFHLVPWSIYKKDPLWVPPILKDRMQITDPERGVFLQRGKADFFIAYDGDRPVGTICAAWDPPANKHRGNNDCLFGFFDCVNDTTVAAALFDAATAWAKEHDLDALYGPYNLDYENAYGILVAGTDRPPALMCGHTPEYYADLMLANGFEKHGEDRLAFAADLDGETEAIRRLDRLAAIVRKKGRITIRGARLDRWDEEVETIHSLLLKSLAHLPGSIPWRRDALEQMVAPFKKIADPELILFAEADGHAVGWFPGVPNLNEALIKANGLRYPWNYLSLLRNMKRQTECLAVKSVLVLPEYWNTGVAILLFDEMAKRAVAKGYRWIDLSITGETNPQTPIIADRLGAYEYKRYRIYRRTF